MNKTEIFEKIKPIIADKISVSEEEITLTKTLKDLGGDSLENAEAVMEIEKQFDIAIPDEHMENFTDIQSIVDYIFNNTPAPAPAA